MRAAPVGLRDGDREQLERWTRSSTIPAGLAQRARIVLLAADGVSNVEISERLGVSKPTVTSWRDRYRVGGIAARSGRPRTLGHREIVAATLKSPPAKLGLTHWSSRLLARHLKIGDATVARAWREYGIQPWRTETFK
jgi:transposase